MSGESNLYSSFVYNQGVCTSRVKRETRERTKTMTKP